MKMHTALSLLLVGLVASAYARHCDNFQREWDDFKVTYDKTYLPEEDDYRMNLFAEAKHEVVQHNQLYSEGKVSFTKEINRFSDMLTEEVSAMLNGYRRPSALNNSGVPFEMPRVSVPLPDTVDWRKKGAVTPIKNQQQCGSCWAFSSTGALEGQHFLKTGKLVSLSEQNLVDCALPQEDGCNGGWQELAFDYIKRNGGIDTEESYPYYAIYNECTFSKENVGATDKGYVSLPMGDEETLKAAVALIGPIAVAIDCNHGSFFSYSSGVLDIPKCSELSVDHAVLVVGYGALDGQDYWLVKNSWGDTWGEQGYVYMARNKGNMCGIASYAAYPLV